MKMVLPNGNYIDTDVFYDLSRPVSCKAPYVQAWNLTVPSIEPVRSGDFIGSVDAGSPVNFRNIFFNPHGHGTHTECLGHITNDVYSVNQLVKSYFFEANLISILPVARSGDFVITLEALKQHVVDCPALIIRTLLTDEQEYPVDYSGSNPPYFESECANYLISTGVEHLLVDLPSVDREEDGGALAFHHSFWKVPENPNFKRTITELLAIPSFIPDGKYLLNLQMMPLENDASPSRPVIFKIHPPE